MFCICRNVTVSLFFAVVELSNEFHFSGVHESMKVIQ